MKPTTGILRRLLDKAALIVISCERTGTSIQRTYTKSVLYVSVKYSFAPINWKIAITFT